MITSCKAELFSSINHVNTRICLMFSYDYIQLVYLLQQYKRGVADFSIHHTRTHILLIGPMNSDTKLIHLVNVVASECLQENVIKYLHKIYSGYIPQYVAVILHFPKFQHLFLVIAQVTFYHNCKIMPLFPVFLLSSQYETVFLSPEFQIYICVDSDFCLMQQVIILSQCQFCFDGQIISDKAN